MWCTVNACAVSMQFSSMFCATSALRLSQLTRPILVLTAAVGNPNRINEWNKNALAEGFAPLPCLSGACSSCAQLMLDDTMSAPITCPSFRLCRWIDGAIFPSARFAGTVC